MGFRLVGSIDNVPVDLPLLRQQSTIGSGSGNDLELHHLSVSRRHARLIVHDELVEVVDLGSSNGTFVGASRILSRRVHPGEEVTFGSVRLRLEQVDAKDLRSAVELPEPAADRGAFGSDAATGSQLSTAPGLGPAESFLLGRLPELLELLAAGASQVAMAQAVGSALLGSLPVLGVEIRSDSGEAPAALFSGSRGIEARDPCRPLIASREGLSISVLLPQTSMHSAFASLAEAAVLLVALASGARPEAPARAASRPPLPRPESLDDEVRRVYDEAAAVAAGEVGVMISGESGVGKEVLGRFIHAASPRAARPFVALNCAALPKDLLEAELFGIERGVATGVDPRPGKFELANGGTLFLDEIGDMDPATQATILRVLQEAEVYRIGASRPRPADVRVIAATNHDMATMLAEGRFREDLYYRIATWEVTVPPLRCRRVDIRNLAVHFLDSEARRRGQRVRGISEAALEMLVAYSWPGNVRQLQKEMARAALFVADGGLLSSAHLSSKIVDEVRGLDRPSLSERVDRLMRQEITLELLAANGEVGRAAEVLKVNRSTLYRRIRDLGIDVSRLSATEAES